MEGKLPFQNLFGQREVGAYFLENNNMVPYHCHAVCS